MQNIPGDSLGDYVDGAFVAPSGDTLTSHDPARDGAVVFTTQVSAAHMTQACDAAGDAAAGWARLIPAERWQVLARFRDALRERTDALADAIVAETGKLRSEARGEVGALISRFDLVRSIAERDLRSGPIPGHRHEQLRFNALGVVGVIGPFNYPLHLCHAYVVPALLLGNPVVVKPSEVTPLSGQRYAEAAHAAGFPAGVLNLVQGNAAGGRALVAHPAVRGLCFTGSYAVGRMITEQAIDRPELLLSLEMGGKNTVVVLDDASVRQAAHEIAVGGYLTTGQRCTATDRVLVDRRVRDRLLDALRPMVEAIRFGDPEDARSFAGPLATAGGRERFLAAIAAVQAAGADPVIAADRADGLVPGLAHPGHYVSASLHVLPDGVHRVNGYSDEELFGPDIGIEVVDSDEQAIELINQSPYGFANSVFTGSSERFEAFYRNTRSGILNRNRSTNKASPRLPFGGVGRSGNYRPAGLYAVRNVVVPVAVQNNVMGTMDVHPMLADRLPAPDLDQLEARHVAEEAREGARRVIEEGRPLSIQLPRGGHVPTSDEWLDRIYAGERVVREKKPIVFDHLRSFGPWMVSVDDPPMVVLDGMSQTATLTGGFAVDAVVEAYVTGGFGDALLHNADTALGDSQAAQAMADALRGLVPGLPHVTYANSGAEANEKAFALCRLQVIAERGAEAADRARKVLAFQGSFHGRTLLSLHATYNPVKREPFEIAGYQQTFAPFPVWPTPNEPQPASPEGFLGAVARGERDALIEHYGNTGDALLAAEVDSLVAVHDALATGEHFACIVEPMQAEGGDRYASNRFFRALRLLTRYHRTPLIFDEVQSGFALGGPFSWHTTFGLIDSRGEPDYPDATTWAKRAQVGVVMSSIPDPEPTSSHEVSLIRGRIHAELVARSDCAEHIQALVAPRLAAIAQAFPDLVSAPRGRGYAFGFDLPTKAHLMAYLGQRFWRGAVVFGAGTRTVRYRLSDTFTEREIDMLFTTVRRSLAWLTAHPGSKPPAWEDMADAGNEASRRAEAGPEVRLRDVFDIDERLGFVPGTLAIEAEVYEPARQTPESEFLASLKSPDGALTVAEVAVVGSDGSTEWQLCGFAVSAPLEVMAELEGPDRDPMLGRENTIHSVSLTIAREHTGRGLGTALKRAQLADAASRKRADGSPRYEYMTGRNRVGHTDAMTHLNRRFGAYVACVMTGQYNDPEGKALYYRCPLGPLRPDPGAQEGNDKAEEPADRAGDLASGLCRPFAQAPESLRKAADTGLLYGPAVNKLTLMNYATTGMVRALEWIGALMPELPHMYLTSCRDEGVDKSLRIVRWHRPEVQVAIGLEGGYVGHTTAAARSITDPAVHAQGPAYFDWPRVPHPADVGVEASIAALRQAVADAGGAQRVFGLLYEVVQERTGKVLSDAYLQALGALRDELDIPLIAVETTTGNYRTGAGPFAHSGGLLTPDILMWWSGGQTGYLHVNKRFLVPKPLTMVSTWDGDEISLIRHQHYLRALRSLDMRAGLQALDAALSVAAARGLNPRGLGAYRVLSAGERADAVVAHLARHGVRVRRFTNGCLGLAPAMDVLAHSADKLRAALEVM